MAMHRSESASRRVAMATVQAVADSTQERSSKRRQSVRLKQCKATANEMSSTDLNQVSGSQPRRIQKTSKQQRASSEKTLQKKKETVSKMGRQIPLTFTSHGKTQCMVLSMQSSNVLPVRTFVACDDDDGDSADSNILMREWLERKADKADLHGLQWYDKSRQLVKISWKHGSKSGWTESDSQVFISWAKCTGNSAITS